MLLTKSILLAVIIGCCTMLTSCSYNIQAWKIVQAQEICSEHGGIYNIYLENILAHATVTCMDGFRQDILSTKE